MIRSSPAPPTMVSSGIGSRCQSAIVSSLQFSRLSATAATSTPRNDGRRPNLISHGVAGSPLATTEAPGATDRRPQTPRPLDHLDNDVQMISPTNMKFVSNLGGRQFAE